MSVIDAPKEAATLPKRRLIHLVIGRSAPITTLRAHAHIPGNALLRSPHHNQPIQNP